MTRTTLAGWGVVVLCAAAGLADAQSPYYPKTHPNQTELPPGQEPVPYTPTKRPILDRLRYGRPIGCWASFNGYTCSSFHSTWTFVFGSCRDFYGEPCLKTAPPSPLPPYAEGDGGRVPPRPYSGHGSPYGPDGSLGRRLFGKAGHPGLLGDDGGRPCRGCARP